MKNLFLVFILLCMATIGMAQTRMSEKSKDGTFEAGQWAYLWGTSADTLTNADTLTYVARIKGAQTFDIKSQLYVDHVSGTADSLKVYTYNSIDGVNWVAKTADSLTIASVTADGLQSTGLTFSDVIDVYKKFVIIQYGTAKTVPKLIYVSREN
jgi:hypothetical protein